MLTFIRDGAVSYSKCLHSILAKYELAVLLTVLRMFRSVNFFGLWLLSFTSYSFSRNVSIAIQFYSAYHLRYLVNIYLYSRAFSWKSREDELMF
jgi:hypothetical protein